MNAKAEHRFPAQKARCVQILTHGHKGEIFDAFSRITEIHLFNRGESESALQQGSRP